MRVVHLAAESNSFLVVMVTVRHILEGGTEKAAETVINSDLEKYSDLGREELSGASGSSGVEWSGRVNPPPRMTTGCN